MTWSREWATTRTYQKPIKNIKSSQKLKPFNRYVTWPGQAVGYKIGQMKILELRKRAEQGLGEKFDIKEFHEVTVSLVLHGIVFENLKGSEERRKKV